MAGCLELGRDQTGRVLRRDGEGNERGRHVHVIEGAGHGVLAADGARGPAPAAPSNAPSRAAQRLAPALRVLAQALEVFLEGQVGGLEVAACGDELGDRTRSRRRYAPR